MSARAAIGLAAALLAAAPSAAADDGAPPRWAVDEPTGHRFRVAFDPASRVTLGGAAAVGRSEGGGVAPAGEIDAGVAYRSVDVTGWGRALVAWQVEHRVATGFVQPGRGPWAGAPAFDAALYSVAALRHDELPSLVLPSSPPVGIPFPFDVGIDAEAGRVSASGAAPVVHVGVLRAALLLDPWRSRIPGRILAIGLGARYDIDAAPGARAVHRVTPMTAGSLRLRVESRDGLMHLDARGEVAPHWSSAGTWALLARTSVHLERTLVALNDQPIAAFLDGGYRFDPASPAAPAISDFRASLGLALNFSLRAR